MSIRRCLTGATILILLAGCAHTGPQTASSVPSWTQPLEDRYISGTVQYMAAPKDYDVNQISVEAGAVGNETTIADLSGPGSILRIYVENPEGRIALYIDDQPEPLFLSPFPNLFMSTMPAFQTPIATNVNGGAFSYVPLPYVNKCRVVYVGPEPSPACEITYATFDDAAGLQAFQMAGMNATDKAYFADWSNEWKSGSEVRLHNVDDEKLHHTNFKIYPHKNIQLMEIHGPAVITEFEAAVGAVDPDILDKLWLAVYWDGQQEPGVLAPLSGLFGSLLDAPANYGGPVVGREDARMWCRFPMPFSEYAEFRIINTSDAKVDFEYCLTWRPGSVAGARYFHARYNEGQARPGAPYRVASIAGSGHYAGTALAVSGADSDWFMGGTNAFRIDGAASAQISSTGMGRYFNAPWTVQEGAFVQPNHGVTVKEGGAEPYSLSGYRVHSVDAIPFDDSLEFTISQSGQGAAQGLRYQSVAFWYQDEPAAHGSLWAVNAVEVAPRPDMAPEWAGIVAQWRGASEKLVTQPVRYGVGMDSESRP